MSLSALERKILNVIQQDIPLASQPFKILAQNIGIPEDKLLGKIRGFKEEGIIRVYSAGLNHRKLGFKSTLIAMKVPKEKLAQIVNYLVRYPEVTHCYSRQGEHNLWAVFLYKNDELKKVLNKISQQIGKENISNLKTIKGFKLKTCLKI